VNSMISGQHPLVGSYEQGNNP